MALCHVLGWGPNGLVQIHSWTFLNYSLLKGPDPLTGTGRSASHEQLIYKWSTGNLNACKVSHLWPHTDTHKYCLPAENNNSSPFYRASQESHVSWLLFALQAFVIWVQLKLIHLWTVFKKLVFILYYVTFGFQGQSSGDGWVHGWVGGFNT